MLTAFRAFAKSPIAQVLLGILVVSFGVWGIRDVFRTANLSDAVVKAGSRPPITSNEFAEIFKRVKAQQEQRAGQSISNEEAVRFGLDAQLVQNMAETEAAAALMTSEGINPADQLVVDEIRKNPSFFNPVTGLFDKQVYQRLLYDNKLTEQQAEGQLRDEIAVRQYGLALGTGLKAPRIYSLLQAVYQHEGRDFSWFAVGPSTAPTPPKPTDAQLNDFIKQNAQAFTKPEMRQLSLVRMSAQALAQTIPAPEAEVQKRFDFEKDALSAPEKRTVIEIPVKDAKTGADIAAKLRAGGDPTEIAKAAGLQVSHFPATPKSAIPDRKVADAAFALKNNEVAGPLQGDLGLAVVKVVDITPAKTANLADVRAKIESEVKQEAAKEKIYDVEQKYENAHSGGSSMAEAAKAAGQMVDSLPPIASTGQTQDGAHANLPPKIMQAAFTLPAGAESEVIDLGQGEYWVVHVDKIIPATLITLGETVDKTPVRDVVTKQYLIHVLQGALKAKTDALVAEIKAGKSLEAAAAEVGAKVSQAENVLRTAAQPTAPNQPTAYSQDFLLGGIFAAKVGDVVSGSDVKPGMIIAKLNKIQEPPPAVLAAYAEAARRSTTSALDQDLNSATRLAAMTKIKPTSDLALARKKLDVQPAPAGFTPGKPKS